MFRGLEFRVEGVGFRVSGLGFRMVLFVGVWCLWLVGVRVDLLVLSTESGCKVPNSFVPY